MKLIILACLASCTPAQRTATLAAASTGLLMVDWHQTQSIVSSCREMNPIIGQCGGRVSPNIYFPVVIAAHAAIGIILRRDMRTAWFATVLGLQGHTTYSNWRKD